MASLHTLGMSGPDRAMPLGGRVAYRVPSADAADLRAAMEDIKAGRVVDVTPEELAEWEVTGELPASVTSRLAALG
jgi:hypothetical protein